MIQSPEALPDRLRDIEHLEGGDDHAVSGLDCGIATAARRHHGAGRRRQDGADAGAPRQARGAGQAGDGRGRFSEPGVREASGKAGVDASRPICSIGQELEKLPKPANMVFMAGRKFGATGDVPLTWAMNVFVPAMVAEVFTDSRIVAYSTGCVYPFVPVESGGATERTPPVPPPGDYANSCVGRERMFEYFSRTRGTPGRCSASTTRSTCATACCTTWPCKVRDGEPIDLTMGHVNVIWQGDANAVVLRCLHPTAQCPQVRSMSAGPRPSRIRWLAESFGQRWGKPPKFTGVEGAEGWLVNTTDGHAALGYPSVPLGTLIDWTADWVARDMPSLNKDTHYDTRDGKF